MQALPNLYTVALRFQVPMPRWVNISWLERDLISIVVEPRLRTPIMRFNDYSDEIHLKPQKELRPNMRRFHVPCRHMQRINELFIADSKVDLIERVIEHPACAWKLYLEINDRVCKAVGGERETGSQRKDLCAQRVHGLHAPGVQQGA
jgi:hypothetical protein